MRILVTGASGFIGRAVVTALARSGHDVRAAARRTLTIEGSRISVALHDDLAGEIDWTRLFEGIDAVVHLAAIAHTQGVDNEAYHRVNCVATGRLAIAAAKAKIARLVFMSSIRAQSGPSADHVLTESDPPRPTDAYGRSKLAAEDAVRASGVPYTVLRPVVVYGPGVGANMQSLLRLCASPWPLPFGAIRVPRSVLALDNLISAIEFALGSSAAQNESFIVADERPTTLHELVAIIRAARGMPTRLVPVPPSILRFATTALGRRDLWERIGQSLAVSPERLIAAGWTPPVDTREALTRLAQSYGP